MARLAPVPDGSEELEQFEGSGAQALADRISEEAARKRTDGHADDITVVVGSRQKSIVNGPVYQC